MPTVVGARQRGKTTLTSSVVLQAGGKSTSVEEIGARSEEGILPEGREEGKGESSLLPDSKHSTTPTEGHSAE